MGRGRVRAVRELHSGGVRVIARDVGAPLVQLRDAGGRRRAVRQAAEERVLVVQVRVPPDGQGARCE